MPLSQNRSIFGIHSIAAYNPSTYEPYGIFKVVGSMTLTNTGEQIPLNGGSQLYPWAVEKGANSAEGTILVRETPNWSYEAFQGATPTTGAAEANGGVVALANAKGSSILAATGIASVGLKSGASADLKAGIYVIKAATSTTVNVYAMTDVEFLRGTDLTFQDDTLKITASALTITTGGVVDIPNLGIEITGGAGTIGMTAGDTAWFFVRSPNAGYRDVQVGAAGVSVPDVGLFCVAQKRGNGDMFFLDIPRCAASGWPYNLTEKAWMESEVSFQAYYDSTKNYVYRERFIFGA